MSKFSKYLKKYFLLPILFSASKYPQTTEVVFNNILEYAKDKKDITLQYRIMMGLDNIGKPVKNDKIFTYILL